ncbi:hypothetical protein Tco_1409330 [Tanacetum coccineum]
MVDVSSKKPSVVGRKRIHINFAQVSQIPLRRRSNIRSLAKLIDVPKSTIHRRIKEGALKPHTNAVKPLLTEAKKKKATKRYYLVPGEEEPLRTCKSKTFMTKVMFLVTVARPRFDAFGNEIFSGKIGIFPLTTLEPAKRSSKNRVTGTLETKPILSVTKEVYPQTYVAMLSCLTSSTTYQTLTFTIQLSNIDPKNNPIFFPTVAMVPSLDTPPQLLNKKNSYVGRYVLNFLFRQKVIAYGESLKLELIFYHRIFCHVNVNGTHLLYSALPGLD